MRDSAPPPYPFDRQSRPPGKDRHDQKNGRSDSNSEDQDRYSSDRTQSRNQNERSHNRHQDRDQYRKDKEPSRPREESSRSQHQQYEERGPSRPREEPSRSQHQHYEKRGPNRTQRDRGTDGHRERGHHYEDRGPSRNQSESSCDHYQDSDRYHSERSYNHYQGSEADPKERSRNREREREQEYYKHSSDRHGYPAARKDSEHYYPSERYPPNGSQMYDMDYSEEPEGGILDCHKCRYLCTGRACCQLVEVLLNMLILICCSVSYNSTGGYTGITNMGGIYYYQFGGAYSGFSGADGEKAQKLDVDFYNLKLPTVTASMAFGGALMTFSCLTVLLGVLRVPWRWPVWLLVEGALDIAIAVGYIPALYFYFQRLQVAYSSQVCKDREELYSSKGYQGFSCALHAADIAAALFACVAILAFVMGAFLAFKGFRTVRRMKKKPVDTLQF